MRKSKINSIGIVIKGFDFKPDTIDYNTGQVIRGKSYQELGLELYNKYRVVV